MDPSAIRTSVVQMDPETLRRAEEEGAEVYGISYDKVKYTPMTVVRQIVADIQEQFDKLHALSNEDAREEVRKLYPQFANRTHPRIFNILTDRKLPASSRAMIQYMISQRCRVEEGEDENKITTEVQEAITNAEGTTSRPTTA